MSDAIVSVIIPAYNSSGTLRLALQTVLWQDFNDFEVWVVGDGCTDDSERVVASFEDDRLHWVNLPSNFGGPSLPRNEGLSRARGRYVAYLGQDDLWFPWHLSELVDCIETTHSDFVYSLGAIITVDGIIAIFSLPHEAWSSSEGLSPINWLHRKNLTETIGSWSTEKKYSDDSEFHDRLLEAKVRLGFRRQLSVLKFPAMTWRMYSIKNNFPQEKYVEAIRQDAVKLRNDLLLEFAVLASDVHRPRPPLYRRLMNRSVYEFFRLYGMRRWPVNQFMYQRYRRQAGLETSEQIQSATN
ncbi:MAG: glycosyltransferase family 2 protein [Candidatus Bathyarchaeia archaeon]